jgi:hypothetical protein
MPPGAAIEIVVGSMAGPPPGARFAAVFHEPLTADFQSYVVTILNSY